MLPAQSPVRHSVVRKWFRVLPANMADTFQNQLSPAFSPSISSLFPVEPRLLWLLHSSRRCTHCTVPGNGQKFARTPRFHLHRSIEGQAQLRPRSPLSQALPTPKFSSTDSWPCPLHLHRPGLCAAAPHPQRHLFNTRLFSVDLMNYL